MHADVPRVSDLFYPVLKALDLLGGSASIDEIDDEVARVMALPDEVRSSSTMMARGQSSNTEMRGRGVG